MRTYTNISTAKKYEANYKFLHIKVTSIKTYNMADICNIKYRITNTKTGENCLHTLYGIKYNYYMNAVDLSEFKKMLVDYWKEYVENN